MMSQSQGFLEVGIAVAFGGPNEGADTAFGILGDFFVWYRDGSTATVDFPSGSGSGRWGDFMRTHRSNRGSNNYDGFGHSRRNLWSICIRRCMEVRCRSSRSPSWH